MADFSLNLSLNLKDLTAKLGDAKALLGGLAKTSLGALNTAFDPAVKGVQRFTSALKESALAIGAASAASGAFIRDAIGAFGADKAAGSRVLATFEEQAAAVNQRIAEIAQTTGRTTGEIANMAAQFGVVLGNAGLSKAKVAELSTTFSQLSIDIAARFGKSSEEVFQDLQGGLFGMERAVRQYGIALDDTAKQASANKLGLNIDHLTDQEAALVNLTTILDQTAKFQGAAAKSTGSYGDTVRRLTASFTELKIGIGGALVGAVKPYLDGVLSAVKATTDWIKQNPEMAKGVGAAVVAFTALGTGLAALGGYLAFVQPVVGAVAGALVALANPITLLVGGFAVLVGAAGIGGLVDGFLAFVANSQGVNTVFNGIKAGVDAVVKAFDVLKQGVQSIGQEVFKRLEIDAAGMGDFFEHLGQIIGSALTGAFQLALPIAATVVSALITLLEGLPAVFNAVSSAATQLGKFIGDVFAILIGDAQGASSSFLGFKDAGQTAYSVLSSIFSSGTLIQALGVLKLALIALTALFGTLYEAAQIAFGGIEVLFSGSLQVIQKALAAMGNLSSAAKAWASDLQNYIDTLDKEGQKRMTQGAKDLSSLLKKSADESKKALADITNPEEAVKRIKAEQEERKKLLALAYDVHDEDALTIRERAELGPMFLKEIDYQKEGIALSKEQRDSLKTAQNETLQAEFALLEARAKESKLLSDELALLRLRRDEELRQAQLRKASAQELAEIQKKYALQGQGLKEQKAREDQDKKASLSDFRSSSVDSRLSADSDVNKGGDALNGLLVALNGVRRSISDQFKNITSGNDAQTLVASAHDLSESISDGVKDKLATIKANLKQAQAQGDSKAADFFRSDLEAGEQVLQDFREAQSKMLDHTRQLAKKIGSAADADAAASAGPEGAPTPFSDLSPVDQAKTVLKQLGEKFADMAMQLNTKIEGFADSITGLATATATLLKAVDIFPKVSLAMETLSTNQAAFGDSLNTFCQDTVSQLGTLAGMLREQTKQLQAQDALLKGLGKDKDNALTAGVGGY